MSRAAAAVAVVFGLGGAAINGLAVLLGTYAEAAALGLVGVSLLVTSQMLSGRSPAVRPAAPRPEPALPETVLSKAS
jgi:hypothetical protein